MPEPTSDLSFEQALEELGRIVHELEDGTLGLEASLARYEEGVKLLKQCYGILERAEKRIAIVTAVREDGTAQTKPFDATATVEAEGKRTKRAPPRNQARNKESPASEDGAPPPPAASNTSDEEIEEGDKPMLF